MFQSKEEILFVKGATSKVLALCNRYYKDGTAVPLGDKQRQIFEQEAYSMGTEGLRGQSLNSTIVASHLCPELQIRCVKLTSIDTACVFSSPNRMLTTC